MARPKRASEAEPEDQPSPKRQNTGAEETAPEDPNHAPEEPQTPGPVGPQVSSDQSAGIRVCVSMLMRYVP